jgi:hypothetical protein
MRKGDLKLATGGEIAAPAMARVVRTDVMVLLVARQGGFLRQAVP